MCVVYVYHTMLLSLLLSLSLNCNPILLVSDSQVTNKNLSLSLSLTFSLSHFFSLHTERRGERESCISLSPFKVFSWSGILLLFSPFFYNNIYIYIYIAPLRLLLSRASTWHWFPASQSPLQTPLFLSPPSPIRFGPELVVTYAPSQIDETSPFSHPRGVLRPKTHINPSLHLLPPLHHCSSTVPIRDIAFFGTVFDSHLGSVVLARESSIPISSFSTPDPFPALVGGLYPPKDAPFSLGSPLLDSDPLLFGFSARVFALFLPMAGCSVASPLCTWLVAACMSVASEKEMSPRSSLAGGRRATRRRGVVARSGSADVRHLPLGSISASRGLGVQNLTSFCPVTRSLFLGENELSYSSLFGPWREEYCGRRRHTANGSAISGKAMAVTAQPVKEVSETKKPHTKQRRVVVTGMGVVSPLGHDPDIFYSNLLEGVSGISEIETFDCASFPTRIAGEIKSFSTEGWVAPKLSKRMDKFMLYMLTAGKKALEYGGITEEVMKELDKTKCGILIGSAMGGMKVFNDAVEALRVSYKKMNPFCVPFATTNMGSAMLAMDLGWMGPNYSISTACATSNFCILNAANHIIRGEADVMLCGGSDAAIIPIGLGGFVACRALSQRNSDPTKASRPWDVDRDGFVMGEGAGVLLLEELEHAKKRGAEIYAEFLGGSFSCDAYHMTEPHPEGTGIVLCIERALSQSGVTREDVNYVNAHATSTPAGDVKEFQALLQCFGGNSKLRVNSTKSMIGHLLGAAGGVEAITAVQAIRTGLVHPNINLENPEKSVDTSVLVGSKKERLDVKVALSNSFGFGGHNSSILFAPYK